LTIVCNRFIIVACPLKKLFSFFSATGNLFERKDGVEDKEDTPESRHHVLSIIVPVRDEEHFIGTLLSRIKASLNGYPYELIVVNDGSHDGTEKVLAGFSSLVISHPKSLGKGAAMQSGVASASGDIILFMDGDGAHEPQDIPTLIEPILERRADMVIGSRALPGSKVAVSPNARRLSNKLASFIISAIISAPHLTSALLHGTRLVRSNGHSRPSINGNGHKWIKITDCTSGLRAITREGWHKMALVSRGFQIETEMIYKAARNHLVIAEVPISCNWDSGFSHLSVLRDGLKTMRLLAAKMVAAKRNHH